MIFKNGSCKESEGGVKISYTKKATKSTRIRWECSERIAHSCKGAITTDLQMADLRCTAIQIHPVYQHVVKASKVKDTTRDKVKKTRDDPSRILVQAVTVTCAYGLLPGKKRLHYEKFFQAIVDASERNSCTPDPESVYIDFELAAHQAV